MTTAIKGKIERITAIGFDGFEHSADYVVDVIESNYFGELEVILEPCDCTGSFASSTVSGSSYQYSYGGNLYQATVDRAKEIAAELAEVL